MRSRSWLSVCRIVAGNLSRENLWTAPLRFFIERGLREIAQGANGFAVSHHRRRRKNRAGWLIHERHELVGESRHRTANTDAAHVRTAADTVYPSALADVTLNHGSPAAELHDALSGSVLLGKLRLLVITAAITPLMHSFAKEPRRPQSIVKRNHRRAAGCLVQKVEQRLHEIIRLHRTTGYAHDGNA